MKGSKIIIFFLTLFLALNCSFSLARNLELEYPQMKETSIEETSVSLSKYVEYAFTFALWALGIFAFLSLVIGGIRWIISRDNPSLKKDIKNQISASILGIIILIFSVMIFNQINPDLLKMSELPDIKIEGENLVLAQGEGSGRKLEIGYPNIGNFSPETTSTRLDQYVRYIFNFALWGAGIVALMMIIIAGTRYLIASVKPEEKKEAKNQITSALIGLIILVFSIIVLNEINTDIKDVTLSELEEPTVSGPGIWVCSKKIENFEQFIKGSLQLEKEERDEKMDEISKNCLRASSKSIVPGDFEPKEIYLIEGKENIEYAVVLHESKNFTGKCLLLDKSSGIDGFSNVKSITPLILREESEGEGVTLYSHRDFNEDVDEGEEKGPYQETGTQHSASGGTKFTNMNPCYSIKIDESEKWIAIAYSPQKAGSGLVGGISQDIRECEVFDRSDRNLEDNFVGTFCGEGFWGWSRIPCIYSLRVLKGQIMDQ